MSSLWHPVSLLCLTRSCALQERIGEEKGQWWRLGVNAALTALCSSACLDDVPPDPCPISVSIQSCSSCSLPHVRPVRGAISRSVHRFHIQDCVPLDRVSSSSPARQFRHTRARSPPEDDVPVEVSAAWSKVVSGVTSTAPFHTYTDLLTKRRPSERAAVAILSARYVADGTSNESAHDPCGTQKICRLRLFIR